MNVKIRNDVINYDARKDSLLVSFLVQNYENRSKFEKKVNSQLMEFIGLIPKMGPQQILITEWHSGYSLGHPSDYVGICALACNSIKPWKNHLVDHIIHNKRPFSKIEDITLLDQLVIDYKSKMVTIFEKNSNSFKYYLPQKTLDMALKKSGFKSEYDKFNTDNEESLEDILCDDVLIESIANMRK